MGKLANEEGKNRATLPYERVTNDRSATSDRNLSTQQTHKRKTSEANAAPVTRARESITVFEIKERTTDLMKKRKEKGRPKGKEKEKRSSNHSRVHR